MNEYYSTSVISVGGSRRTVREWAYYVSEDANAAKLALRRMLDRLRGGWDVESAILTPAAGGIVARSIPITDLTPFVAAFGISEDSIRKRVKELGVEGMIDFYCGIKDLPIEMFDDIPEIKAIHEERKLMRQALSGVHSKTSDVDPHSVHQLNLLASRII